MAKRNQTEKEKAQAKLDYEVESTKDDIVLIAQNVRKHALRIKAELDDVIRMADQVLEHPEDSIHFTTDPWRGTSWGSIQTDIVKLDTTIRAYTKVKRIINLSNEIRGE